MGTEFADVLPAFAILNDPYQRGDLQAVASAVGLSACRAQRVISNSIGESPKQYQLRTRVELGAIMLRSTKARIIDIALATGFSNHETFSRAFANRFALTPRDYRLRHHRGSFDAQSARTATSISRCLTLYHHPLGRKEVPMEYDIEVKEIEATPVLYKAMKVDRDSIGSALGECLPAVFGYVMENGLQPAGHPYVRYMNMSDAFFDIEAGIPLVEGSASQPAADTGIAAGELPAGKVASTIHTGPYEGLREAYAAIERWLNESSDHEAVGPPWEVYLTDPGEVPNPEDWQTEVLFPIL